MDIQEYIYNDRCEVRNKSDTYRNISNNRTKSSKDHVPYQSSCEKVHSPDRLSSDVFHTRYNPSLGNIMYVI